MDGALSWQQFNLCPAACKVSRLRPNLFRKRHPDLPELWVIERALPGDIYSYVAKFFNY
jgi:hypothetical protein